MRQRNPYARRKLLSARQLRRAAAPSPHQRARTIQRLQADAHRLIADGLAKRLEVTGDGPATARFDRRPTGDR